MIGSLRRYISSLFKTFFKKIFVAIVGVVIISTFLIAILDIFKWIKKSGVADKEMIKTFNCGVGFCIIIKEKNLKLIEKYFKKSFKPYVIGKIINGKNRVKLNGKLIWEK